MAPDAETPIGQLRQARAVDGVLLQYEVIGAGEPVVFQHGGLAGRDAFTRQRPLAEHFQLVLRDMRGHNGSEVGIPPDYAFDTTEVDDVLAVLDAEGLARAHMVGHSSGGAIALAVAQRSPERVGRMVLLEPTLLSLLPEEERARLWANAQQSFAVAAGEGPLEALLATMEQEVGPGWRARLRSAVLAQLEAGAPMCTAYVRGLHGLHMGADDVQGLRGPTLLLYGGRSFEWERHIRDRLTDLRPDWPCRVIEDAGHVMHLQRPEQVNAAILDFLHGDPC